MVGSGGVDVNGKGPPVGSANKLMSPFYLKKRGEGSSCAELRECLSDGVLFPAPSHEAAAPSTDGLHPGRQVPAHRAVRFHRLLAEFRIDPTAPAVLRKLS